MAYRESLSKWTETLIGLPAEEVSDAIARVESWRLPPVTERLCRDDVDSAVAAYMLVGAMDCLAKRGVPDARLHKKLRSDPGAFWSTWAEFRVADILTRGHFSNSEVRLEEGKSAGAQPDFRFVGIDHDLGASVEIKAVGLSDQEVEFSQEAARLLPRLLPRRRGFVHLHVPIDAALPRDLKLIRDHGSREAERSARQVSNFPTGLRGAVIVGSSAENNYVRRAATKVVGAVRQLPDTGDECWVALYWSNGASMDAVLDAVDWREIPDRVQGLLVVGSGVAFPDRRVHVFQAALARQGARTDEPITIQSLEPEKQELAELVFEHFERSSGVRPTLLQVGRRVLISRAGRPAISPFNLLLSPDPKEISRSPDPKSVR